jgi:hypothetical protein
MKQACKTPSMVPTAAYNSELTPHAIGGVIMGPGSYLRNKSTALRVLEGIVAEELGVEAHVVTHKHVLGRRLVKGKQQWAQVIILSFVAVPRGRGGQYSNKCAAHAHTHKRRQKDLKGTTAAYHDGVRVEPKDDIVFVCKLEDVQLVLWEC